MVLQKRDWERPGEEKWWSLKNEPLVLGITQKREDLSLVSISKEHLSARQEMVIYVLRAPQPVGSGYVFISVLPVMELGYSPK